MVLDSVKILTAKSVYDCLKDDQFSDGPILDTNFLLKHIRNVQWFKELEYHLKMSWWFIAKKIRLHLAIFRILELVTTWINQPRLEKEEFVMVVPGRKGLHLLVTFVNIKDIIKALFICNAGHNNNKQPLVINYSYWCKKSLLITKLPPLMIHSFICLFM